MNRADSDRILQIALICGIMLLLLTGGILGVIHFSAGNDPSAPQESRFSRLLRDYDFKYKQYTGTGLNTVQLQELDNTLDRLEKRTEGVESWLSILKRRRQLAALSSGFIQSYRQSSRRALLAFPHSEPVAAAAAAALVRDTAITRETDAELRKILPLLESPRYIPIRLGFHVLLGDFKNPERAAANLPGDTGLFEIPGLFPEFVSPVPSLLFPEAQAIVTDFALLKIIANDKAGAESAIRTLLSAFPEPDPIRFAAEYFYDFGDLRLSAELFSYLPGEADLSRQADALWLAGYTGNARNIWNILALPEPDFYAPLSELNNKALYNYAVTAEDPDEAGKLFEQLVGQGSFTDMSRQYGLIRFSRTLDVSKAIALLKTERGPAGQLDPLFDLEAVKRNSEKEETARVIAETWLLLGRYPEEEDLYRWGAWYFDLQRNLTESSMLLKAAARHDFSGKWIDIHEGLRLMREGRLDAAEEIFAAVPPDNYAWAASANLGRLLEIRRSPARAIESYLKAADALNAGVSAADSSRQRTASRIQLRIGICHKVMGNKDESRKALENALYFNPDNLSARLELERM